MTIEHKKANLWGKAAPVGLQRVSGLPAVQAGGNAALIEAAMALQRSRDATDKLALVELVRDFDHRGKRLTTSFTGSATAYKVLKVLPDSPADCTSGRLTALLQSMEAEGQIFRCVVKTADQKNREAFTLQPGASK